MTQDPIEYVRTFMDGFCQVIDYDVRDLRRGYDLPPRLAAIGTDGQHILADLQIEGDFDDDAKTVIADHLMPQFVKETGTDILGFASFAWVTILAEGKGKLLKVWAEQTGADLENARDLKRGFRELALDPDRKEAVTVVVISRDAEYLRTGYVERPLKDPTRIEWIADDAEAGTMAAFITAEQPERQIGGRFPDGMRNALAHPKDGPFMVIKGTDWRNQ